MTELKDGIKKITSSWGKDNGLKFLVTTDEMDDLAQRIADALVVDEDRLRKVIINCDLYMHHKDDVDADELIENIKFAKPIGVKQLKTSTSN